MAARAKRRTGSSRSRRRQPARDISERSITQTGGDIGESVSMQDREDENRVGGRERRLHPGEDTAEGGRAPGPRARGLRDKGTGRLGTKR